MRKKILVISHERSGTHFLINTIAQCFNYLPQQIDLDNSQNINWGNPDIAKNWMQQFQGRFVAKIFKSHHANPVLSHLLPELQNEYQVFYIQRDGRDVMTSFWIYLNRLAPGWGPRARTVGEFMRATAAGGITQYQATQKHMTMLQRWATHVEGWNQLDLPIHYVTYEDLQNHHQRVSTVRGYGARLHPSRNWRSFESDLFHRAERHGQVHRSAASIRFFEQWIHADHQ